MKKKIFILIPLLFLLCGCTAEVNVDIEDMQIKEHISIDAYPDSNYNKSQLLKAFREYIPINSDTPIIDTMPDEKVDGVKYYNRSYKELDNNGYRIMYDYNFNINNYARARSIKGAFKSSNVQVNKKDQEILISTDTSNIIYFNDYPSLNSIIVNVHPSYKVKENNADKVDNGTYTWIFNRDSKKSIYLLLDTNEKTTNEDNPSSNNPNKNNYHKQENKKEEDAVTSFVNKHPFLVAIGAIILFILIVTIVSKITKNKY